MRRVAALLAALATLTLTGCEDWREQELRLGIECRDAGGEWAFHPDQGVNGRGYSLCHFDNPEIEVPDAM